MILARHLQEILAFRTPSPSLLSLYLDVDAGRGAGAAFSALVKTLPDGDLSALTQELQAVEQAISEAPSRGDRGLAIFSSQRFRLMRLCPLPEPVKSRLVIDCVPHLAPMLDITDQYQRYGVAIVSAAGARFLEYFMGHLRELPEHAISAQEVGGSRAGLARAATARLETLARQLEFQRVIIGCSGDLKPLVAELLHRTLRETLIIDDVLGYDWPADAVRERIAEAESQARRLRELVAAQRLIDEGPDIAALGLWRSLEAVNRGRAKAVLVRDGFAKIGRRCTGCQRLSIGDNKCTSCGSATQTVFNLIEELCDRALEQGAHVLRLLNRTPLDNIGCVAVELRALSTGAAVPAEEPAPVEPR